jgi:hypothetical protein
MVTFLCDEGGVSRSGYYNYFSFKSIKQRETREELDLALLDLILEMYTLKATRRGLEKSKTFYSTNMGLS